MKLDLDELCKSVLEQLLQPLINKEGLEAGPKLFYLNMKVVYSRDLANLWPGDQVYASALERAIAERDEACSIYGGDCV